MKHSVVKTPALASPRNQKLIPQPYIFLLIAFSSLHLQTWAQVTYFSPQAGSPTYFYRNSNGEDPRQLNKNNNAPAGNYGAGGDESYVRYQYATPDTPYDNQRAPVQGEYAENVVYTVPNVVSSGNSGRRDDRFRQPNNYYDNRRRYDNNNYNYNQGRPDDRRRPRPPVTTTSPTPDPRRQYPRRGCNCSPEGSVADECDYRGQCHCRPHVVGRSCDRCEDNFIALGTTPRNGECRECDPCYSLLQPEIENMRRRLAEVRTKIQAGGGGGSSISDKNFEDTLRDVTTFVEKLYRASLDTSSPSSGAIARFRDFQNALREIQRKLEEIVNRRIYIGDQKNTGQRQVEDAKATIDRIEDLMKQLDDLLRRQGREALDDAKRAEQESGRQSQEMTQMAEESRRLAEQHEQDAAGVKTTADEALRTSTEALQLAREAFAKQEETSRALTQIQRGFGTIAYELDQAQINALDLFKRMKECREEARKVFEQVRRGGGPPSVSLDDIRRRAEKVLKTAQGLINVGERLKNQYGPLIATINEKIRTATQIYEESVRLQQLLDGLLEEASSAYKIAIEAKAKADGIIDEARETLRILKNFDDEVRQSKNLADEALQQMSEIERIILEAEGKTSQANGALVGSGQSAESALNDAAEALRIALEVSDVSMDDLMRKMRELSAKAIGERGRADDLAIQVDNRNEQLKSLEDDAENNIRRAGETERISKEADAAADTAVDKAEDVLGDLEELLRKLSLIGTVNPGFLGQLGEDFADLEDQLRAMTLDEQLSQLEVGAKQQQMLIDRYTLDLTQLQKDVANIQDIREALPDGCYKNIKLEEHGLGGTG